MGILAENLSPLSEAARIYRLKELPQTLVQNSQEEKLYKYLTDFDFLEAKIYYLDVQSVIQDYELIKDISGHEDLKIIQRALEMSSKVVEKDKAQLASQLLGRLLKFVYDYNIRRFLDQVKQYKNSPWLQPLSPSLNAPQSLLTHTLLPEKLSDRNQFMFAGDDIVTGIALTPNNKNLVSSLLDGRLIIWDLVTGTRVRTISNLFDAKNSDNLRNAILGVAITPDGKRIVSALRYNKVKVWDLETGDQILPIKSDKQENINTSKLNPPKNQVSNIFSIIPNLVKTVKLQYSLSESIISFNNFYQLENPLIITSDSKKAVSCDALGNTLKVWDLNTGVEIFNLTFSSKGIINSIAITPDNKWLVAGGAASDYLIVLWHLDTGRNIGVLNGHASAVKTLAITPDGKKLVTGSKDQTLIVWDLATGNKIHTLIGHASWILSLAITPDSKYVVSASKDESIRIWNLDTGIVECILIGVHTARINKILLTKDGKYIVSSSDDYQLVVWDLSTGQDVFSVNEDTPNHYAPFTVSSDNKRLISTSGAKISIWDLATNINLSDNSVKKQVNLESHDGKINTIIHIPSKKWIISASSDSTIKVWNLVTGKELKTLTGHTSPIAALILANNNDQIFSVSQDGIVKLWDLVLFEEIKTFKIDLLSSLFSNSKEIVSISETGKFKVWNMISGEERESNISLDLSETQYIRQIVTDPSNQYMILSLRWNHALDLRGHLIIADLTTGQKIQTLVGHTEYIDALAITSDKKFVISGSSDETIKIWEISTGKTIKTLSTQSRITKLTINPYDNCLASGCANGSITIWNILTGKANRNLQGHTSSITTLAITSDNQLLISGSEDGTIIVWDIFTGKQIFYAANFSSSKFKKDFSLKKITRVVETFSRAGNSIYALTISPDGKYAVSGSHDKEVSVWDIATGKEVITFSGHDWMVESLAITPNSCRIVSASDPGTLKIWNLSEKREELTIQDIDRNKNSLIPSFQNLASGIFKSKPIILVDPSGKKIIAATISSKNCLKVYDLSTGKEELVFRGHTKVIKAISITSDGRKVVSASEDKTLKVWNFATGKELLSLKGHTGGLTAIAITPDGSKIVSASEDKTLKIWNLTSGEGIFTLEGHTALLTAIAITPDGSKIVSASEDKTLKIWNLTTGKALLTLKGHKEAIVSLNIIYEGKYAVSTSIDETIIIWSLITGKRIATFTGEAGFSCCAITPNQKTVVAGDKSGQVHLLRLKGIDELEERERLDDLKNSSKSQKLM